VSRFAFFDRGKGHGARTTIVALRNSVNLRRILGEFLIKAGDRLEYDFSVWEALSSSHARHQLKSLEYQGVVKVEIVPKRGSANQRQARNRRRARKEHRRRKREERRRREREEQEKAVLESKESKTSEPELESKTSLPTTVASSSSLGELETESSSGSELPDVNPDEPGQQVEVDADELRTSLESQLTDIHGVSRKMANTILDLPSWDRESVDGIRYMRTENVPQILAIIVPHRKVFGR